MSQKSTEKTIFQSQYSLEKYLELSMEFRNSVVIMNAADPDIFHSLGQVIFSHDRKTRLIASSWSDIPNKGASVYKWLEAHLDWE